LTQTKPIGVEQKNGGFFFHLFLVYIERTINRTEGQEGRYIILIADKIEVIRLENFLNFLNCAIIIILTRFSSTTHACTDQ
jgi:hypothetical protein